jgi:hypothetical protein
VLRAEHLAQPAVVTAAYAPSVHALVAVPATLNEQPGTARRRLMVVSRPARPAISEIPRPRAPFD